jgi:hypothetical protein
MKWLLMIVTLGLTGDNGIYPASVMDVQIKETYRSKQTCADRVRAFYKESAKIGARVPPEVNMVCVPFREDNKDA